MTDESWREDAALLPAYLQENYSLQSHVYGTLSYNRRSKCWVVKGDPSVTEMCKRLFPGSAGSKRGEARFTAHRRMVGELCWLMLRFPLDIRPADREMWEQAVNDARCAAVRREKAALMPGKMEPPEGSFTGKLMNFQQEGLAFLMQHDRCLLADEMGLGKTVQALAAVAELRAYPLLLVVPSHLMTNWQREIENFLTNEDGSAPTVHVLRGLTPYELPEAQIYIVHYLLLRGWKNALPRYDFACVIFDEIQELRHSGTEKYSAASLLAEKCSRVMGLSGTPIYNRGGEIWNVINILDFHALGDWESFTREWCYGYGNNIVAKPDLLGETLREEGYMLRRTKEQVLDQLPPKRRLVQEIDADDEVYRSLMEPVREAVYRLKHAQAAFDRTRIEDEICQRMRQATGVAKAPYVAAFLRALLEGGEKVLLFAHHHQVMDAYKPALKAARPVFITGRETTAMKDRAVDAFMSGKTDLCCISMRAAAGLNLQRATCVVFGELDWSPAVHTQAEDRAHRMGQKDSVLCYYLVSPAGSDAQMQEALGLKVSQFVQLMGDTVMDESQSLLMQQEAREHIRILAEQLAERYG